MQPYTRVYLGRCAFQEHELRRAPVTQTEAAKERIMRSSEYGRLLPQALSEYFGRIAEVERIELDIEQRGVEEEREEHIVVTVHSHVPSHTWTMPVIDLDVQRRSHLDRGFDYQSVCEEAVKQWMSHCEHSRNTV